MRRRPPWPVVVVVSFTFPVLMSACSSGSSSSVSAPVAAPSSSTAPASSAAATVPSSAQPTVPTVAAMPLVVCRTTFGITPPPAPKAQPTSVAVRVPGGSGSSNLAVYTDDQGYMRLLGPQGWSCSAMYGADGSGGVVVYPAGEPVPSSGGAGWKLSGDSSLQAIVGSQSSACVGCAEAQACPLFGTAAKDFQANFERPCPASRPTAEITTRLSSGVMAFADPAGVAGDGIPSGGRYPANGVMTYYSGNDAGSWVETCTLPTASKDVCTTTLNYFLASYRNR